MAKKRERGEVYVPKPGVRFYPTDEELILHYLIKKVRGEQSYHHIVECDVYSEKSPWDLLQEHHSVITTYIKTGHLYAFTILKKTSKKVGGRNYSRLAGEGKWHGNTAGKPIHDQYKNIIGFKKQFKFMSVNQNRGEWIMHEYSLGEQEPIVLCEIFKKKNKGHNEDDDGLLVDEQDIDYNDIFPDEYDGFMDQQEVDNNKCLIEHDGFVDQNINYSDIFSVEYDGIMDLDIDYNDIFSHEYDGFMYQQEVDNKKSLIEYDGDQGRGVNLVPEVGNNNLVDTDTPDYAAHLAEHEKCCFQNIAASESVLVFHSTIHSGADNVELVN